MRFAIAYGPGERLRAALIGRTRQKLSGLDSAGSTNVRSHFAFIDRTGALGPLIRDEHRRRVLSYLQRSLDEGARAVVDGRQDGWLERPGFFLGPSILDRVTSGTTAAREEIFGPVLAVTNVSTIDEAIMIANQVNYGNMAVIFTSSGRAAHQFREQVEAGIVGINVGVAQPFAFFPFSGWKGSFYGDLHLQGTDGVDFYTRKKMVVTRW